MFRTQLSTYFLLLGFAINAFLWCFLTWATWSHSHVDTYQSLYVFRAVFEGAVLYRDVSYYFGPFAPYLHSYLFSVFGLKIEVLYWVSLANIMLVSYLVFRVVAALANRALAWSASFIFLNVFAFSNVTGSHLFNFVLPYSFSSTYALLFLLASVFFQIRALRGRKLTSVILWALCVSLLALNRLDVGLMYFGISFIGAVISLFAGSKVECKSDTRKFLLAVLIFALVVCGTYGVFVSEIGFEALFWHNIFWFGHLPGLYDNNQSDIFARSSEDFLTVLKVFVLHLLLVLPFLRSLGLRQRAFLVFENNAFLVISLLVFFQHYLVPIEYVFADTQLLLCLSLVFLILRGGRLPERKLLIFLNVICILLLGRIFFRLSLGSYFFYLGVLPLILLAVVAYKLACGMEERKRKFLLFWGVFFFAFTVVRVFAANTSYAKAPRLRLPSIVKTEVGEAILSSSSTSRAMKGTIDYLKSLSLKPKSLLVLPEGSLANFFLGIRHPLYYPTTLPHVLQSYGEPQVIDLIASDPPEVIVLLHRFSSTYRGKELFGIDYGSDLLDWVFKHYSLAKRYGRVPASVRAHSGAGSMIFIRDDLVIVDIERWLKTGLIEYRPFRAVAEKRDVYESMMCKDWPRRWVY